MSRHTRDLTTGSIPRHLISFALPMLAGTLLQAAYSFINAYWVGKYLGTTALAAVTTSFPIFFILMALAGGLTLATSILISQYVGAKNWTEVKRVVQGSTLLIIIVSFLLLLIGELIVVPILRLMNTPPEVLPFAVAYLRIMLLTMPCSFGVFLVGAMMRGAGDSTTPVIFQGVSVVLTAILDPVLMFGWLHLPRLGLNGTAVATVIAAALALAALLIHLERACHLVAPDWRNLRVDWPNWALTFKIGIPSVIQQSLASIGMIFVIGFVNGFGENAAASFGATMRIDQLAIFPAMSVGMAVSTLTGQNIGAGRYDRVHRIFIWGIALGVALTLVASALAVGIPHQLMGMMVNDPAVIAIGVTYLRIIGACYVLFAITFAANGVINGAGYTVVTTVSTFVSFILVRAVLASILCSIYHRVEMIWYAMAISFGTSLIISLGYYFTGHWKRALIRHSPIPAVGTEDNVCESPSPDLPSLLDSAPQLD